MSIFYAARKVLSVVLTFVMMLIFSSGSVTSYTAKDSENVKLNFTVFSDCHIEGNNFKTYEVFSKILREAKANKAGNDAIVFLGDNTMNGQEIESLFFFGAINQVKPAKQVLTVVGNHDVGNGEGDYDALSARFMGYSNIFFDLELQKPYYYKVINDCYFIVLATERSTVNQAYITETQYTWLQSVLDEAAEKGAPIFVFNHYPPYYLEGENQNALTDILKNYDNLLYFCGHTHIEMSESSFSNVNGVNTIWLPKTTEHAYEDYDTGIGVQVEVYENEILVRGRDYYNGAWMENLTCSYEID